MYKYCLIDPETKANKNVPNLGLSHISAAMKKKGINHIVIDQDLMPFPKDRFMKIESEIYGISIKLNVLEEAKRITKLLHEKYKDSKIMWGGPHITHKTKIELKKEFPYVEMFVGYFDMHLLETNDINEVPFQTFEHFDSKDFIRDNLKSGYFVYPLSTSRGCPFRCTYCASDKIFKGRSAQLCVDEIENAIVNYGIRTFQILDDNFIMIPSRANEFCQLIKEFNMNWMCPNGIRADQFTEAMARTMKNSGCYLVSFGVENIDEEVLKTVNKGETFEEIEKAIKIAKKYFKVNAFFIIGLPNSTFDKDMKCYEWAKEMGINATFGILVAIPGTDLYEQYYDFVNQENLKRALHFDDEHDMVVSFETKEYPAEQRLKMYQISMGGRR